MIRYDLAYGSDLNGARSSYRPMHQVRNCRRLAAYLNLQPSLRAPFPNTPDCRSLIQRRSGDGLRDLDVTILLNEYMALCHVYIVMKRTTIWLTERKRQNSRPYPSERASGLPS